MVAGEADHDVTGTFVGIGFQPGSGFLGRTAEARLELPKRCSRDIVVVLKKFIEPLVCLIGIVVDGQCEIDRTAKIVAASAGFIQMLQRFAPLRAPDRGVCWTGGEPAVEIDGGAL